MTASKMEASPFQYPTTLDSQPFILPKDMSFRHSLDKKFMLLGETNFISKSVEINLAFPHIEEINYSIRQLKNNVPHRE